jgi:hypothetical protein
MDRASADYRMDQFALHEKMFEGVKQRRTQAGLPFRERAAPREIRSDQSQDPPLRSQSRRREVAAHCHERSANRLGTHEPRRLSSPTGIRLKAQGCFNPGNLPNQSNSTPKVLRPPLVRQPPSDSRARANVSSCDTPLTAPEVISAARFRVSRMLANSPFDSSSKTSANFNTRDLNSV